MKVAVVGPGMMGSGIAASIAAGGPHEVWLCGRSPEAAERGRAKAEELRKFLQANGATVSSQGSIKASSSLKDSVSQAEIVFESISEDLPAKQALFKELEGLTASSTVLCTNTSSLSVAAIVSACSQAGAARSMAAHFIGPAHLVPLVELCPANASQDLQAPVLKVRMFLESIGKRPVLLKKEIEGFIAARLQAALYRECLHLVESGVADCDAIDSAVVNGFGRRLNQIGPFQQADFAGVDLTQRTHARFFPQLGSYDRDVRADRLVATGRTGAKSLQGHHDWTEESVQEVAGRRDAELLRRLLADRVAKL